MIGPALTQSELLSMWERGEGQRPSGRAQALLSTADDERSFAAMPVGRRDAALLDLRVRLFGDSFNGLTTCPTCGGEIELTFDASEVVRDGNVNADPRVREAGYEIVVRTPASEHLAAIESMTDLDAARAALLRSCITSAVHDGERVDPEELPADVIECIVARLAELDPQADVALELTCPECMNAWREPFDIVTYFWTEVSVAAKRLLGEVHELASAYGWSESDILQLSAARRSAYLEMVR